MLTAPLKTWDRWTCMSTASNAEYLRLRQDAAREMGCCVWCAKPVGSETALCEACRTKKAETYQARRAEAICTKCGGPGDGQWACETCREAHNERRREARAEKKTKVTKRRRK